MTMAAGGLYSTGTTFTTNSTSTNAVLGGGKTTFKGDVIFEGSVRGGLKVDDVNVGEALKLLMFFLQSRYPEVIEEFEAIRKIEES